MPRRFAKRIFAGYLPALIPLLLFAAYLSALTDTGWGSFLGVALLSAGAAWTASVAVSGSVAKEIKGISGLLGGIFERFPEAPPPESATGDELEMAAARARSLADRIMETMELLRDEKEKIRAIIEQMDDGVALIDSQSRIILYNAAFTRMFDVRQGIDCAGMPIREAVRNPSLLGAVDAYVGSGSTGRREITGAGGNHISAVITPFMKDSPLKRTLLILHDITQQKNIERMRADFVANASHELKTPLTAIRGFVETITEGNVDDPETAKQFLGIIQKHVERLSRLVDDLLTLSDIELGKEKLEYSDLSPETLLKGVEQFFMKTAQTAGIAILVKPCPGIFKADRDKLTQILVNLVDNAIKYTPRKGRIDIECRLITVTPGDMEGFDYPSLDGNPLLPESGEGWERKFCEYTVSDTGEGIPQQSIPRLMERFYRVDTARSRERGGTGLGLSIVKHILIAHGGSIKISSELGKGTAIRFIIPA